MATQIYTNNTESVFPDNQFKEGIQIIVNAYETQTNYLSSEINRLNEELNKKNSKINEIEEFCSSILKQNDSYKISISSLTKQNEELSAHLETLLKEKNDSKNIQNSSIVHTKISKRKEEEKENQKNYSHLINKKFDFNKSFRGVKNSKKNLKEIKKEILNYSSKSNTPHYKGKNLKRSSSEKNDRQLSTANSFSNLSNPVFQLKKENNNDFFQKCRNYMSQNEYSDMIDIVHLFNSKQISKQEAYDNIMDILLNGNYEMLIKKFNELFS